MAAAQEEALKKISVRMPDAVASGVYANIVQVNASENEIVFDFVMHTPNQEHAVLSSRVIVSPATAQQLADILEASLRKIKDLRKDSEK